MEMMFSPSKMSLLFLIILMRNLCSSHAHTFIVGGHDGWTLNPLENYSHWAKRHRFQINDVLVFKYKRSHDSVLVVSKDDFLKCNKKSPIKTLKDSSNSRFKFTKSGPFFFISGHDQNCEMGQKLIVIVLSPYHHHNTTHNSPPPSALQPPSSSPAPSTTTHLQPPPPVKQPSAGASIIAHSPSPSPTTKTSLHPFEPLSHSPKISPAAGKNPSGRPYNSPSPSVLSSQISSIQIDPPVEQPSDHSPSSSHAAAKTPTYAPSVEPVPSPFTFPSPAAAKTPTNKPSTSSAGGKAPTQVSHSPSVSPISHHSSSPQAQSPKNNIDICT